MAINKIDFPTASTPSYTPSIVTDYNNQNENIEASSRGYNAVSLTNWDGTTTAPLVALGSVLEINGSFWEITTDTAIATTDASSGVNYLVFDDAAPGFGWNDTAPTWSDTLNGWYVSGDRATGHTCEWDGATAFSEKRVFKSAINTPITINDSASGGVRTDNAAIKTKYLTGTLDGASDITLAHGIASGSTYIISVTCMWNNTSVSRWEVMGAGTGSDAGSVQYNDTNIYVSSISAALASKDVRFMVSYLDD